MSIYKLLPILIHKNFAYVLKNRAFFYLLPKSIHEKSNF